MSSQQLRPGAWLYLVGLFLIPAVGHFLVQRESRAIDALEQSTYRPLSFPNSVEVDLGQPGLYILYRVQTLDRYGEPTPTPTPTQLNLTVVDCATGESIPVRQGPDPRRDRHEAPGPDCLKFDIPRTGTYRFSSDLPPGYRPNIYTYSGGPWARYGIVMRSNPAITAHGKRIVTILPVTSALAVGLLIITYLARSRSKKRIQEMG